MPRARRRRPRSSAGDSYTERMFGDVLSIASTLAENRRHVAAGRLSDLATATRKFTTTAGELPYLTEYTDAAAERIDEFADYVDRTDIPEMLEDLASFTKRQPVATLALGVAAGLVTTQLLRGWPISGLGRASTGRKTKSRSRRMSR